MKRQNTDYLRSLREVARQVDEANKKAPTPGRPRAERRAAARKQKLDQLVPDRICPQCGNEFLQSRSWIILTDDHRQLNRQSRLAGAICRSCACSWLWHREGD